MKEFLITINQTLSRTIRVEAEDEDEAKEIVDNALNSGELRLNYKEDSFAETLENATDRVDEKFRSCFQKIN